MKHIFLILSTLILFSSVHADDNPDAGKVMRFVCYGVRTPGDLSTRDPNYTIVVELQDTMFTDASYYVPGNTNFDPEELTPSVNFNVSVFKDADSVSQAEDAEVLAEELLAGQPHDFHQGRGAARDGMFLVRWDGSRSIVRYNLNRQEESIHVDSIGGDSRVIYCEAPFAVDDPVAVQVQEDQSAELEEDTQATVTEI